VTPAPRRARPRRRNRTVARTTAAFVALGVAFGVGIALGEALHDNPDPGSTQTLVRTLRPLPLSPAPVTVTVQKPRS
jgi:hypothetical protein